MPRVSSKTNGALFKGCERSKSEVQIGSYLLDWDTIMIMEEDDSMRHEAWGMRQRYLICGSILKVLTRHEMTSGYWLFLSWMFWQAWCSGLRLNILRQITVHGSVQSTRLRTGGEFNRSYFASQYSPFSIEFSTGLHWKHRIWHGRPTTSTTEGGLKSEVIFLT